MGGDSLPDSADFGWEDVGSLSTLGWRRRSPFFSLVLAQIMICEGGAGSPFSCAKDFLINTHKNFK